MNHTRPLKGTVEDSEQNRSVQIQKAHQAFTKHARMRRKKDLWCSRFETLFEGPLLDDDILPSSQGSSQHTPHLSSGVQSSSAPSDTSPQHISADQTNSGPPIHFVSQSPARRLEFSQVAEARTIQDRDAILDEYRNLPIELLLQIERDANEEAANELHTEMQMAEALAHEEQYRRYLLSRGT